MFITRNHLIAAAVTAATALVPAAALAARADSHPVLKGSPQMRSIDDHHAKLNFASERLPRTATGKLDAKITYAAGLRVSNLKQSGRHGSDFVYTARVTSKTKLANHQKFAVRFRLGDSPTVQRTVKLYKVGEHG